MNTMADGAAQRLVAQIGEALFGQPGLTLMELAEKVKASQPSPAGQDVRAQFEAWMATQQDQGSEHVMAMISAADDRYQSPVTSSMWSAWQAAHAAREAGRINGWRIVDGVRVFIASAHASILDDQQYVRYDDYLSALSVQASPAGQVDALTLASNRLQRLALECPHGSSIRADAADWAAEALAAARQPVGEPVEFDYPEFHQEGMGCGLEDRGITDRYEAMRYGFDEALDQMAAILDSIGPLYAAPAQAVDLGAVRNAVQGIALGFDGDLPYIKGIAEALALIDSQAVGK